MFSFADSSSGAHPTPSHSQTDEDLYCKPNHRNDSLVWGQESNQQTLPLQFTDGLRCPNTSFSAAHTWDAKQHSSAPSFWHVWVWPLQTIRYSALPLHIDGLSWGLSNILLRLHQIKWLSPNHLVHLSFFSPSKMQLFSLYSTSNSWYTWLNH